MTSPDPARRGPVARVARRLGSAPGVVRVAKRVLPVVDRLVHRLSGGRTMLSRLLFPTLELTTTGRRSGKPRRSPLAYVETERGWAVAATNFGQERHPAWSANLLADPNAMVEVDGAAHRVRARLLEPDERTRVWPRFVEIWPPYDDYVDRVDREIRVFELERVDDDR